MPTAYQGAWLVGGQPDTSTRGAVAVIGARESCSGSLIAPNLVLTARHCIAAFAGGGTTVQCGTTNFADPEAAAGVTVVWADDLRGGVVSAAVRSAAREIRTPAAAGVCGNDVALLILGGNVASSAATPLVPRLDAAPQMSEAFNAVGYGVTDPMDTMGTTYGLRRKVSGLSVLCVGIACTSRGPTATEWQATTPVCLGDSGSPALDSAGLIIGVASRSDGACQAALYSAVSAWKSFLVTTALEAAAIGGYPAPSWANGDAGSATDGASPPTASPDAGAPSDGGMSEIGPVLEGGSTIAVTEGGAIVGDGAIPIEAGAGSSVDEAGSSAVRTAPHDAGGCAFRPLRRANFVPSWVAVVVSLGAGLLARRRRSWNRLVSRRKGCDGWPSS